MTRVGPVGGGGAETRDHGTSWPGSRWPSVTEAGPETRWSHTNEKLIKHTATFTHDQPSKGARPSVRVSLQTVCHGHSRRRTRMEDDAPFAAEASRRPAWAPRRGHPSTPASVHPHETQFSPTAERVASILFPAATARGPPSHILVDPDLVHWPWLSTATGNLAPMVPCVGPPRGRAVSVHEPTRALGSTPLRIEAIENVDEWWHS